MAQVGADEFLGGLPGAEGGRLGRLARAAVEMTSARSLEEILEVATAEACALLGAAGATARLDLPDGGTVDAHAGGAGTGGDPRGSLAAPLQAPDGPALGLLQVDGDRAFDEDDELLLRRLAQLAAGAAENVRLVEELRFKSALLEAEHETAIEGLLVVGTDGSIIQFNRRFVELWDIPDDVVASRSDEAAIASVLDKLEDPDEFVARIEHLYEHPEVESRDEIRLRDGRAIDRYSAALRGPDGTIGGRVWFFRDITDRVEAERELRQRLDELAAVYRMAETVARAPSLQDVLEAGLDAIASALALPRSSVLLFDDAGVMRFRAWRGLSDEYRAAVDGHSPWTQDTRDAEPIVVSDVELDEELAAYGDVFQREGIRALAFVPLVHRRRLVGKFMLYHEEPREFSAAEIRLAETISGHIAAATERKRAEDALAESRNQLDVIFRSVADGITAQGPDGRVLFANDGAARMCGFESAEAFLAAPLSDIAAAFQILDEERRPIPFERLPGRRALGGEGEIEQEVCYRVRATGDEHWSIVRATPVHDPDGRVVMAINVFHDVTERKHAEDRSRFLAEASAALASSLDYEKTLNAVAELAIRELADWCAVAVLEGDEIRPLAVAHRDPELVAEVRVYYERIPPRLDASFGVGKVIRTGEPELIPEVSPETVEAAERERPGVREVIDRIAARSVMIVPLTIRASTLGALTFVSSEPGRVFEEADLELAEELARRAAVAIDNARLYRAAESRAQAATALQYVGDGVFLVDDAGIVRLWNPAAGAITGLNASGVVGRHVDDALAGWPLDGLSLRPQTRPVEVEGRELWLSITAAPFAGGTVYAYRDVTHERMLERLKTEFVSTVSHELRTPVTGIYGAAMTLRRDDIPIEPEQREQLLEVVASESERLKRIIDDVLWTSRIDTAALDVVIETCEPRAIAEAVLATAAARADSGIDLSLVAPPELPAVAGDREKVRQVLVNLVDNAIKYSPDGGRVEIALEQAGDAVRFSVRDEGLGIPASEHGRIFEKFFRLDPNLTRGVGGTGLGLYICRELVRRMDGRVAVVSAPGEGSTFSFELPLAERHAPPA